LELLINTQMGTNYYARINTCEHCGRFTTIHIGKSSCGWRFNVEVHEGFYIDYDSFRGFVNLENVEIWNEYDEKISKDIFITMIQKKTKDKAHSDDYPDNCKSDGDIELNYGEFS